jgi:uncharacterized protein
MELSSEAVRVLGCLVEKQMTTPDTYPMSLNGIVTACNQSTNRDPVMSLAESSVQRALDELRSDHRLVRMIHAGAGSRVDKFRHALDERLGLTRPEMAVLAMLALRGPQTAAEVKARTERMAEMSGDQIERVIDRLGDPTSPADPDEITAHASDGMMRSGAALLAEIPDGHARPWSGPLVQRLPKSPGQKEGRVVHLLSGAVDLDALSRTPTPSEPGGGSRGTGSSERMTTLEATVATLAAALHALRAEFDEFRRQF